jgi:hypothetical protein
VSVHILRCASIEPRALGTVSSCVRSVSWLFPPLIEKCVWRSISPMPEKEIHP